MNKLYKKGYYYELKVKRLLENQDYLVWRSPGSKSPIDIIAINEKGFVRLIQVKSYTKIKKEELEILKKLANQYQKIQNVEIELWIFKGRKLIISDKKALLNL